MEVTFYGVRGSIPTPQREMMRYGGNTTCLYVRTKKNTHIILDSGSGIRLLGRDLLKKKYNAPIDLHLLLSHTHWDHIQGFPFFEPIFNKDYNIVIHGKAKYSKSIEETMRGQMEHKYFPVSLDDVGASMEFRGIDEGSFTLNDDVVITARNHYHPGGALGYRIEADNKIFVFSTDTEHVGGKIDERVVELAKDADLLVHDTQYDDETIDSHAGWGHSSYRQACEVAKAAGVKRLYLFHYDPYENDKAVEKKLKGAKKLFKKTFACQEGVTVAI